MKNISNNRLVPRIAIPIGLILLAFLGFAYQDKLVSFFNSIKGKDLPPKRGNYYEVVVYQYTAGGRLDTVEFLIDPRVIDSLGFTRDQISSSCSMLAYLAADLSGQRFKFDDKQEVRIAYGSPMVIIKGKILPHDEDTHSYFIAKADRKNTLGPYGFCSDPRFESLLKERAK